MLKEVFSAICSTMCLASLGLTEFLTHFTVLLLVKLHFGLESIAILDQIIDQS